MTVKPFGGWHCIHSWWFGVRLGKLFVRVGNNGHARRDHMADEWLVDLSLRVAKERR